MKKFFKLTAVALAVIMCISGCAGKEENTEVDAKSITDVYTNATDAKTIDNAEAYKIYTEACDNMEATESISIKSDTYIDMTIEEKGSDATSAFTNLKRVKKDDSFDISFEWTNQYNEESNTIKGYYLDGTLYYTFNDPTTSEDVNLKEDMGYEDVMYNIQNYIFSFDENMLSQASSLQNGDSTDYFFSMDKDSISDMIKQNLEYSGVTFEEGDSVDTEYASMEASVNKDNIITSFTLSLKANVHNAQGDIPFVYNIDSEFFDIGKTKIDEPESKDIYISSEEYANSLNEGTQEEGTASDDEEAVTEDAAEEETENEAATDVE